jgi:phosphotriesterase-related protein
MSTAGATVQTVLGPVPVTELGRTLVHEHVLIAPPGSLLDVSVPFDRGEVIARAVAAFEDLKRHDVTTFVDPCPIELGRDPGILAEVSRQSGLNVICATGFYVERDSTGIPAYWRERHPEEIAQFYLSELENGIAGTGIRPGVIKAASGSPVGRHEEKVLKGAAIAAAEAGVTVITHTENSGHSLEQQEILVGGGAPADRVVIGHQDQQSVKIAIEIARRGSYVGVDRVGYESIASDDSRADLVAGIAAAGYLERICISQDRMSTYWTPRPSFWVPHKSAQYVEEVVLPRIRLESTERGFSWVFDSFVAKLVERGLTESDIETIFVTNPRRLFGGPST